MHKQLALAIILLLPIAALAHVGSPDVYYEGDAGPYHLLVTVRPPAVIPGIAEIVHDAELLDEKFGRKEGFGRDEVMKGWAQEGLSDQELLKRGMQLAEGLYKSLH